MKFVNVLVSVVVLLVSGSYAATAQSKQVPQMRQVVVSSVVASSVVATSKRHKAIKWAKTQRGKRYCYGGNGPSCYDCSGLVKKAYAKAGISLPRTAQQIWASSKTKTVSKSHAKWGDLVFWFSNGKASHVEFLAGKGLKYSYGAHHSGTRIGWRKLYGSPRFAHVNGAG